MYLYKILIWIFFHFLYINRMNIGGPVLVSAGWNCNSCCNSCSSSDSKNDPAYGSTDNSTNSSHNGGNDQSAKTAKPGSVNNSQTNDKTKSGTDITGGEAKSPKDGTVQSIVLSLEDCRATTQYNYNLDQNSCTYTAKTGYGFKSVKSCNTEFWKAEENKHSNKVEFNHKDKIITIHISDGSTKKFKKESSGCKEVTEGDQKNSDGKTASTGTGRSRGGGTTN